MTEFDAPMRDMVAIAVDAARLVAEAMPLMRDVGRNGGRLHELTERWCAWKAMATKSIRGSRRPIRSFATAPISFAVRREIYKHLERLSTRSRTSPTRSTPSLLTTPEAKRAERCTS